MLNTIWYLRDNQIDHTAYINNSCLLIVLHFCLASYHFAGNKRKEKKNIKDYEIIWENIKINKYIIRKMKLQNQWLNIKRNLKSKNVLTELASFRAFKIWERWESRRLLFSLCWINILVSFLIRTQSNFIIFNLRFCFPFQQFWCSLIPTISAFNRLIFACIVLFSLGFFSQIINFQKE